MHSEGAQFLLLVAGLGLGFANALASSGSAVSLPILLALRRGPELANGTNRVAVIRPSRWVNATGEDPRVGPLQFILVFVIGIWTGFIVLDGGTYLPLLLVLSVGFSVLGANAAKAAIMTGYLAFGGLRP